MVTQIYDALWSHQDNILIHNDNMTQKFAFTKTATSCKDKWLNNNQWLNNNHIQMALVALYNKDQMNAFWNTL